jgi:HSP20 family protein
MTIKDLAPWKWGNSEKQMPVKRETQDSVLSLHQDIDRIFDDFFRGFGLSQFDESWGDFSPRIDVSETDQAYNVSAELPGLDENDIEVTFEHNTLTISGEKKTEKEDKGQNYYRMERSYGSFRRSIPVPANVEADQIDAKFKKGVLNISLPKSAETQEHIKHIPVKTR